MAEIIETKNLELHLISVDDLISLFQNPKALKIYSGKDYSNPHRVLVDDQGPLPWRVPQVQADPSLNIWFVRWIVKKSTREIVGSISFHGKPNESGMIEIGLEVHESFQNQGIATEALKGMWGWVIDQLGVQTLRYTVSETNAPSIALIGKFGFDNVGIQIDEEDGPEIIFEMSAERYRSLFCSS